MLVGRVGTDPFSIIAVRNVSAAALGAVLGIFLVMDHVDGKRYPWTHWLGVGTELWSRIVVAGAYVALVRSFY